MPFDGNGVRASIAVCRGQRLERPIGAGAIGKLIKKAVALDDGGLLYPAHFHLNRHDIVRDESDESARDGNDERAHMHVQLYDAGGPRLLIFQGAC
jgi:hypothetical protein